MTGVRARTGVLLSRRLSVGAALGKIRPKSDEPLRILGPASGAKSGSDLSDDTWELIAKFGSSSVPNIFAGQGAGERQSRANRRQQ